MCDVHFRILNTNRRLIFSRKFWTSEKKHEIHERPICVVPYCRKRASLLLIALPKLEAKKMFEGLFQPMHLLVILVIVLIIFGPGKLPELGNSIGRAIKGFKKAMSEPEEKSGEISEAKKIEDKKE
jgi:sec-independent protein translocase protein TatA